MSWASLTSGNFWRPQGLHWWHLLFRSTLTPKGLFFGGSPIDFCHAISNSVLHGALGLGLCATPVCACCPSKHYTDFDSVLYPSWADQPRFGLAWPAHDVVAVLSVAGAHLTTGGRLGCSPAWTTLLGSWRVPKVRWWWRVASYTPSGELLVFSSLSSTFCVVILCCCVMNEWTKFYDWYSGTRSATFIYGIPGAFLWGFL